MGAVEEGLWSPLEDLQDKEELPRCSVMAEGTPTLG